jgi:hypothetical protein
MFGFGNTSQQQQQPGQTPAFGQSIGALYFFSAHLLPSSSTSFCFTHLCVFIVLIASSRIWNVESTI